MNTAKKSGLFVDGTLKEIDTTTCADIVEYRRGVITNVDGFVEPTNNAYAWWGWEVVFDDGGDGRYTGRIIVEAGNNASGKQEYFDADHWKGIDIYLKEWDLDQWTEFRDEGVLQ